MNLESKYPILVKLLSPFRKSQQKTCLAIVSAILERRRQTLFRSQRLWRIRAASGWEARLIGFTGFCVTTALIIGF